MRKMTRIPVALLTVCMVAPAVLAAEHGGATMESQKEHGGTRVSATTPTTPKPAMQTAEGSITELDLQANSLKLTTLSGVAWTLILDPKSTTVFKGGKLAKLNQVMVGDQARILYSTKDGKQWAKNIQVLKSK